MSDALIYNTLIQNAWVVDGSGAPAFQGDIAILGEQISVHPPHSQLQAHSVINATGLYLAPGFIDVHTHDDLQVIKSPQMCAKISQGVTTVIVGNCGISASPVTLKNNPPNPMNLLGQSNDFIYSNFRDYTQAVTAAKPSVNVGALVGHTSLRSNHMEDLQRTATAEEITAMKIQLREALADGALGLSSGLAYDNAYHATTDEVKALVEELAAFDAIYTTHLRTEFDGIIEAMSEAFSTARHGKIPLIISHLKCAGAGNWGRSDEVLLHLDTAAKTQKIACDCYPYSASSSTLDLGQVTDDYDVFITWSEAHPQMSGRLLADIAAEWDLSLLDAAKKLLPAGAVYHGMDEQDVRNILRYPRTMIGSDGLPNDPHPHPRLWGTFPRVIAHYARDLNLFDLPTAIHKMSGLSAQEFNLGKRGLIANHYFADLVLFDIKKINDTATFEKPQQLAAGIEKVWVNGQLSFSDGQVKSAGAGKFLYRNQVAEQETV
jgi:N-acyl-D-aspartate/D-glutamate deacylase